MFDLTLLGKVLIVNCHGISKLKYSMSLQSTPADILNNTLREIKKIHIGKSSSQSKMVYFNKSI